MGKKAAVVVGVNTTGNMPSLSSAAKGAEEVAAWLGNEGYDVECITDKTDSVTSTQIFDAIDKFVTVPARYEMLVVYFSGHGQWQARSDYWLLSGAPAKPQEAINLDGTMDLAKYSGIPNIVFISDVCRTIPDTRAGQNVSGIEAFPNLDDFNRPSNIDYFKASCESLPAFEAMIDGEPHSFLTLALKSAFDFPKKDMIKDIKEGNITIQVVPNRKLMDYLQPKVDDLLFENGFIKSQPIDIRVPSNDSVYISRIRSKKKASKKKAVKKRTAARKPSTISNDIMILNHDISDDSMSTKSSSDKWRTNTGDQIIPPVLPVGLDAANAVEFELIGKGYISDSHRNDELLVTNNETEFELTSRLPRGRVDHFESETGFIVFGAEVDRVELIYKIEDKDQVRKPTVDIMQEYNNNEHSVLIRIWTDLPALSVFIKLKDGRSAILACLHGYIGFALFNDDGLTNLSYVPATNNHRWGAYEQKQDKINRLRALVSLAVEYNTFKIDSDEEGESLASEIRMEKAVDPTLGLYAAHAFNQAGNENQIADIRNYMQHDLSADLFDVKVLSSRIKHQNDLNLVVPICPMLTQTWNLLRSREVKLPEVLIEAESYLCDSLWTTFQPEATNKILDAIEKGELS